MSIQLPLNWEETIKSVLTKTDENKYQILIAELVQEKKVIQYLDIMKNLQTTQSTDVECTQKDEADQVQCMLTNIIAQEHKPKSEATMKILASYATGIGIVKKSIDKSANITLPKQWLDAIKKK